MSMAVEIVLFESHVSDCWLVVLDMFLLLTQNPDSSYSASTSTSNSNTVITIFGDLSRILQIT